LGSSPQVLQNKAKNKVKNSHERADGIANDRDLRYTVLNPNISARGARGGMLGRASSGRRAGRNREGSDMPENNKLQRNLVWVVAVFFVVVLGVVTFMTLKNTADLHGYLEDSVKSQLISASVAARKILDVDRFESYNSVADTEADADAYAQTLAELRQLQLDVGAEYIYALKQLNENYYFVFDTDTEDEAIFIEYELSPVHEQAFLGRESADTMNVDDEYGSYNTGAVPIWKDGKVIGIISTDIADTFLTQSTTTARLNAVLLISSTALVMILTLFIVLTLMRRVQAMQDKLFHMANYDTITGLPNRQYLMNYLALISDKGNRDKAPFALFFIDLDNFKKVNDGAGHDAGDELLRHISSYLDGINKNAKAFRPSAGILNISARIGGDEFLQVVPDIATETEAAIVAQKVLDGFRSQALDRFIDKYKVGLSIGVALFPYHSDNFNVLIKYADVAMYHAKQSGKHSYCVYTDSMGGGEEEE
jgi:diguanylate cyclase (GGDEF)-like protein